MNDSWPPQLNRLDSSKLLRQFRGAAVYSTDNWRTIDFEPNEDLRVQVSLPEMAYGPETQAVIENVLTALPAMDNDVLESCIARQEETKARACNYQNALVLVTIERSDHAVLTYLATRRERIWTETFTRTGDGWQKVPGEPGGSNIQGQQTDLDSSEAATPTPMHRSWPPQLGRLNADGLLRQFAQAPVLPADDWETAEIMINDDFSVVVPLPEESYGPETRALLENVLIALPGMDDAVLQSCIDEQRKTKIDGCNYQNALVLVTLESADHVVLSYFGVNTNWDESFRRLGDRWMMEERDIG